VVHADHHEGQRAEQQPAVDPGRPVGHDDEHERHGRDGEVQQPGDAAAAGVGEQVRSDQAAGIQFGG
jgi:hypothetical protein